MSNLALYRQYRPDCFEKVIGQDHIIKTLENQIKSGRIGHAYLFTGTRGTGKTTVAKIFAKAVNCLDTKTGSPCGKCDACKALSDPSNIDIIEIDGASNNGVNEIRDLKENIQFPPVSVRYKVYIIDEVHMLSIQAFNALLKTLEEPPKHAIFILATTEVQKIPATILSRCMRFDFKLVPTQKIANLIAEIFKKEGKEFEDQAVNALAVAGEGSVRDAISLADTCISAGSGKLTFDEVNDILGICNFDVLSDFIVSILKSETGKVLSTIDKLCNSGKSVGVLIKDCVNFLRNLLIIKTCEDANAILRFPEDRFNALKEIASKTNEQRIIRISEIFSVCENETKYSAHPRIAFETASVKASKPESDYDLTALISRINDLENRINSGVLVEKQSEKPVEKELTELPINVYDEDKIKSKFLFNVRSSGSEMLWLFLSSVEFSKKGNILTMWTKNEGDEKFLFNEGNKKIIDDSLSFLQPFVLEVKPKEKSSTQEIDNEAERVKKLFGDDIVIIK